MEDEKAREDLQPDGSMTWLMPPPSYKCHFHRQVCVLSSCKPHQMRWQAVGRFTSNSLKFMFSGKAESSLFNCQALLYRDMASDQQERFRSHANALGVEMQEEVDRLQAKKKGGACAGPDDDRLAEEALSKKRSGWKRSREALTPGRCLSLACTGQLDATLSGGVTRVAPIPGGGATGALAQAKDADLVVDWSSAPKFGGAPRVWAARTQSGFSEAGLFAPQRLALLNGERAASAAGSREALAEGGEVIACSPGRVKLVSFRPHCSPMRFLVQRWTDLPEGYAGRVLVAPMKAGKDSTVLKDIQGASAAKEKGQPPTQGDLLLELGLPGQSPVSVVGLVPERAHEAVRTLLDQARKPGLELLLLEEDHEAEEYRCCMQGDREFFQAVLGAGNGTQAACDEASRTRPEGGTQGNQGEEADEDDD